MPARGKDTYCIRSVENALFLLEALAEEDAKCSLSQLSQRLGMTKASLFRLMATFESHGYVERGQDSGEYQLGLAAFEVGQKLLSRMTILAKARPVMNQLVRQCNETAYLVVQRGDEVLFLEMVDNDQKVKVVSQAGRRLPLTSCAAGKIFLAFATEANQDIIKQNPQLSNEIETYRKHAACIDQNGVGEGSTCIAVPLYDSSNQMIGGLTLVAPSFRMSQERIDREVLPAIKAAGEMVSARLGYLGYSLESGRTSTGLNA